MSAWCLTCPRPLQEIAGNCMGEVYGRFHSVPFGWRWIVVERGDDSLYRWVGPKPMWSRLQAARVAQALNIAKNSGYDLGRQDARAA
jgi:hypothetical protein